MEGLLFYFAIFVIGLLGSLIGTIASGSGLVVLPALLLMGIEPHVALASMGIGIIGLTLGPLYNYARAKKIIWNIAPILTVLCLIGSFIGARILIEVDGAILKKIVGVILLLLIPVLFLGKNTGLVRKEVTQLRRKISYILFFFVSIWFGFFSPGSGSIAMLVMVKGHGLTILEAKGTLKIPGLVSTLSCLVIFAMAGIVDYRIGALLAVSTFIGSWIGSHIAIKKGDAWVRPLIVLVMIISGLKMLF